MSFSLTCWCTFASLGAHVKQVTFIEIYNECVYDLLRGPQSDKTDLPIRQDNKGKTYIEGVNKMTIDPTDLQVPSVH